MLEFLCSYGNRGILGNHYNGNYDPIWDIDAEIETLNASKGWQIGIHVDAASKCR